MLEAVNLKKITETAITRTPDPKKIKIKKCSVSSHIVTHLCQFMAQNSKIWGVKKFRQLFDISKFRTYRPSKWPIGHIFKNPNQGIWSTLGHTYGLILDEICQWHVPFKVSQMCQKPKCPLWRPVAAPEVCHTPPKMVRSCSPFIPMTYIKSEYGSVGALFPRYLWFCEGTHFCQNFKQPWKRQKLTYFKFDQKGS